MKGLLRKDFLVIAKQMKLYLLLIPIMAIVGGGSMASIAILLGAMLPMTAIAYDEQSKWNELAVMMPYSKKSIVLSKYLLGYLCMAGTALLFAAAQLLAAVILHMNLNESFSLVLLSIIGSLLLIAVNTPIMFRFGSQKGRFVFIGFMGLVGAAGGIVRNAVPEVSLHLADLIPLLAFAAVLILNAVSVFISLHLKQA